MWRLALFFLSLGCVFLRQILQIWQINRISVTLILLFLAFLSAAVITRLRWGKVQGIWLRFIMVNSWPQRAWRNHIDWTGSWVTYRHGDCAGGWGLGWWLFSKLGTWGKTSVQILSNLFLKILTKEEVTTEAEILFQCFTTLAEKADPFPWQRLLHWSTL